ncbi:hypothetical protein [Tenggerimyces flavus]|uniref:Uncharacterized protein n=1 Tax=Tenggerimyces flavus TaxID=1708749 RepID=A0ABV7YMI2_9ACTN|nr:hypothetical protein [Tenggerimyces flavus]MBM7789652.1 hypothetical protein [Tenggerimyces flavus]
MGATITGAAMMSVAGLPEAASASPVCSLAGTNRPFILHFSWNVPPLTTYGAGTFMCVNWWASRHFPSQIQAVRANDCEVVEYTLPVSDYPYDDGTNSGVEEMVLFYTGGSGDVYRRRDIPLNWYWDPSNPDRVTVPNYSARMMDIRANSAFFHHLLEDYYPARLANPNWKLDGFFLDVLGDGYLAYMTGASAAEQEEMRAGMRWFVAQLRDVVGDECILINNNYWLNDNFDVDGIMLENHVEPTNAVWPPILARTKRGVRRRNLTTNPTAELACGWAQIDGVDQAGFHPTDYNIGPPVPYGDCGIGNNGWPASAHHLHLWDSTTAV